MIRKTTWQYDPNWDRCECFDERGEPMGYTFFVPAAGFPPPATRHSGSPGRDRRLAAALALLLIAGWLLLIIPRLVVQ